MGNNPGVFLGDEHMWFGVKVSEVKLIADLIRSDWPVSNTIPSKRARAGVLVICSQTALAAFHRYLTQPVPASQRLWAAFPP